MLGACSSSPGLALPKSRIERLGPELVGPDSLSPAAALDAEDAVLPFRGLSRSCCMAAAFLLRGADSAGTTEEVAAEGIDVMGVNPCFVDSVFGWAVADGGGGARFASAAAGLAAGRGAGRAGWDGEGGEELGSWGRGCEAELLCEC